MENISKLFLYLLYANDVKIKNDFENLDIKNEQWYDVNIFKYLKKRLEKNNINFLVDNLQKNETTIIANYDYKKNEYYDEYFIDNSLNYHVASLALDKYGLQRSQIKTLTTTLRSLKKNKKFIPINGGPGTGKSTLLNYIISNILISYMMTQYKNSQYDSFTKFIKDKNQSKFPTFLLTGTTKVSVQNISDVCKINKPKKTQMSLFKRRRK